MRKSNNRQRRNEIINQALVALIADVLIRIQCLFVVLDELPLLLFTAMEHILNKNTLQPDKHSATRLSEIYSLNVSIKQLLLPQCTAPISRKMIRPNEKRSHTCIHLLNPSASYCELFLTITSANPPSVLHSINPIISHNFNLLQFSDSMPPIRFPRNPRSRKIP